MNRFAFFLVATVISVLPLCALSADRSPAERALEAAYFGDQAVLREVLGFETNYGAYAKAGTNPGHLVKNALMGNQYATISLLAEYGLPFERGALRELFASPLMTPEAARIFITSVTNFVTAQGPGALRGAVQADNYELCRVLLAAGVKPDEKALPATFLHRDLRLIQLLLKHGADPYLRGGEVPPVHQAFLMRSADLLQALDTRGEYRKSLRAIEEECRPSKDSKLPGTWRHSPSGGGFGSFAFTFYPDGTVFFSGDGGAAMGVWKENGASVAVTPIDSRGKALDGEIINAHLVDGGLALDEPDGRGAVSPRIAKKFDAAAAESEMRYPPFIRMERVVLTAETNLIFQVNGRHRSVPLSRLIKAAQATPYGTKPVEDNLLAWAAFTPGPIKDQPADAVELPCSDRHASPVDAKDGKSLGFDTETPTSLEDGREFTVFPSGASGRYYGPDTGRLGEVVQGYAILARKPFSHGKDWLMLFFMKSKKND